MAGRFSYSPYGELQNPWFRLGKIGIGSAAFVALSCAVMMVIGAFVPQILFRLSLSPFDVRSGQIWRVVTWPLASEVGFFPALAIVFLWLIGTQLEVQIGRNRMAFLLGVMTVIIGVLATTISAPIAGVWMLEFVVILLFIADNPNRPFLFGIPGWVLGAFLLAIQVLQLIQYRERRQLLLLVLTLLIGLLIGRAIGLLGNYPWIPRLPLPAGLSGQRKVTISRRSKDAPRRNHRGEVISGPWAPEPPSTNASDQVELDGLLDKISASGLESLSKKEKQRLNELSKKLR